MQGVFTRRLAGLGLAAVLTATALGGSVAVFVAGGPGENLRPIDGAELLVELTQSQESVLWVSLAGQVSTVRAVGWPVQDGDTELGGGLVIERPANPTAGVVDIGEAPMSLEFSLTAADSGGLPASP